MMAKPMLRTYTTAAALLLTSSLATLLCGCGSGSRAIPTAGNSPALAVQAGPQLGYLWNHADQTLRPILGIAGSSQLGESVVPAGSYVQAAGSAAGGFALLFGNDQKVYRMTLPSGTPTALGITAGPGAALRFSPSGTSAAIFVPGSSSVTLLTSLSGTAQVHSVSSGAPIVDLATSDDGTVAAVFQTGSGYSLAHLAPSSGVQTLLRLGGSGGLSFIGTTDDLLAADTLGNSLTLIRAVSSSASKVPVPSANLLKTPIATGASFDGRWAVVANAGESSVIRFDLSGATPPQRIVCPLQPTGADQLAGNGVFRFTAAGSAPGWIADITAPTPAMLFIPALPAASTTVTATPVSSVATPASSAHGS